MAGELDEFKKKIKNPNTPETRKAAADELRKQLRAKPTLGRHNSKPNIVSLSYSGNIPRAVPIEQIPDELERNPDFYDHIKKIVED